jgi:hypothetical protein
MLPEQAAKKNGAQWYKHQKEVMTTTPETQIQLMVITSEILSGRVA